MISDLARTDYALGGIEPQQIFSPRDADDLARVLAECDRERRAVIPWGGGTMQHLGASPARMDAMIQTSALNNVIEYEPADLTITVQAGMTLDAIENVLAPNGQFLPLDIPQPQRATIGGVLATGASGPLRLRYGPPRDFTLGLKFASVDGKLIKAGGKVVKNVAGYELTKVIVGSMGTLGIITQATFKIFPKPPHEQTLLASFANWRDACAAIPKLWNLHTPPLALELFDAEIARLLLPEFSAGWLVAARFGGANVTMQAADADSKRVARDSNARSIERLTTDELFWRAVSDLPETLRAMPDSVLLRIGAAPKDLATVIENILEIAATQNLSEPRVFAHAATAIIYATLNATSANAARAVQELRAMLAPIHAHVMVESAPVSLKQTIPVWDEVGASLRLIRAIKQQFDPNGILNPGRFAGGV